ncbi:MAG: signal peptidase I [Lachnospiraceae bacterium]|nr:signal peptidase I [Lachnospiraceae bacterium]
MNQTVKKIWNGATTVLVGLVVILAVLLAGVRVVGLTPYTILSGSMEPQYPVGALIYVKKTAPESIQAGDNITFILNEELVVATHQVYKVDLENQQFYTQGIANKDPEGNIIHDGSPVHFNNLIGKPIFCIPGLGYVSDYVTKPPGIYLAASGALILLILTFVPDWIDKADEIDRRKSAESELLKMEAVKQAGDGPEPDNKKET